MAKTWTGRERMKVAMSGKCPDRIPTMPQICHPHAVHLFYDDYRRGIAEVMENPALHHELILKVAQLYGLDGIRLFCLEKPVKSNHRPYLQNKDGRNTIRRFPR